MPPPRCETLLRLLFAVALVAGNLFLAAHIADIHIAGTRAPTHPTRSLAAAVDAEEIHTFHTICGDGKSPIFGGYTVVKSLLQARARSADPRRRVHIHLGVDAAQAALLASPTLAETHPAIADVLAYVATDGRVRLSVHTAASIQADMVAAVGAVAADAADVELLFRPCVTMRLKLPFLAALEGVDKLLFIDYDAVVLCDLGLLWDGFASWPAGAAIGAAEEAAHAGFPSHYRPLYPRGAAKLPTAYASGMNAGVLALRLDRLRAVRDEYWGLVGGIAAQGGYAAPGYPVLPGSPHAKRRLAYSEWAH